MSDSLKRKRKNVRDQLFMCGNQRQCRANK